MGGDNGGIGRRGNVVGELIYAPGYPCDDCGEASSCDPDSTLCVRDEDLGPNFPPPMPPHPSTLPLPEKLGELRANETGDGEGGTTPLFEVTGGEAPLLPCT